MAFHNVKFPTDIAYGTVAGPRFKVRADESDSGADTVINRWSSPLHMFDVKYGIRTRAQIASLLSFFMARRGPENAFRFKDFSDFTSHTDHVSAPSSIHQAIGTGNGTTTEFQLVKAYSDGSAETYFRNITKPVLGTVLVAKNAVLTPTTDYDVNYELGKIYFVTAPANGVAVTAGFEFDVAVRFKDEVLQFQMDDPSSSSIDSMELVEITDEDLDSGLLAGGSELSTISSANLTMTAASARVQALVVTASGKKAYLPPKSGLPDGYCIGVYNHNASSFSIEAWDQDGGTSLVAAIAVNGWLDCRISRTSSNTKEWIYHPRIA